MEVPLDKVFWALWAVKISLSLNVYKKLWIDPPFFMGKFTNEMVIYPILASGKRLHSCRKSPSLIGKSRKNMAGWWLTYPSEKYESQQPDVFRGQTITAGTGCK